MDIRKRIIWVVALTIAVATIQLVASRRKAEQLRATDKPVELHQPNPNGQP